MLFVKYRCHKHKTHYYITKIEHIIFVRYQIRNKYIFRIKKIKSLNLLNSNEKRKE